jgi:hypothetical protein
MLLVSAGRSPPLRLAAKMVGVPIKMRKMFRCAPVARTPHAMATREIPISVHEHVAGARAGRNGRNNWRRNHYRRRYSDADIEGNARRGEHRATRQKQSR